MIRKTFKQYGREDRNGGKGTGQKIPVIPYVNEGPVEDSPTGIGGYLLKFILDSLKESGEIYVDNRIKGLRNDINYVSPGTLKRLDGQLNPNDPLPFGYELHGLFDSITGKKYVNNTLNSKQSEYAERHETGHGIIDHLTKAGKIKPLGNQQEEKLADLFAENGEIAFRSLGVNIG
jgi:hypothetical protein